MENDQNIRKQAESYPDSESRNETCPVASVKPDPGCPPIVPDWYVIRTTYQREEKFVAYCEEQQIECFLPKKPVEKIVRQEGEKRIVRLLEPVMHNIVFVRCEFERLKELIYSHRIGYARFYYDLNSESPLVVPAVQMESFMAVHQLTEEDIVWLEPSKKEDIQTGTRVKVMQGPFAGIEGIVKRVKGQQRVIVNLSGLVAVATAYVPTAYLQKL